MQIIIIGLDGATFDLIMPLVKAGRLPTLARLLANGARGRLISTIPPATVPAWPTFMTGKSPGKHGVFDFFKRDAQGRRKLVSARDINGPTLWRLLSDNGRRCIVLNVPCTYPPEAIDGVLVSGMLTHAGGQYVNPPEMAAQLDAWTGGYRVNPRAEYVRTPFDRDELIRELHQVSDIQKQAFIKLLQTQPWDLAMLMFRATDVIQHKLWHKPQDVAEMYEFMDAALAEILAVTDDAHTFLVSDHGFGVQEKLLHINYWLREQGWLEIRRKKKDASTLDEPTRRSGQDSAGRAALLRWWLTRLGVSRGGVRKLIPQSAWPYLKRIVPRRIHRWMPASSYELDWSHTRIFSDSSFTQETQALRINLRGREPGGIVELGEYQSFRNQVIRALQELQDPENGAAVVAEVYKGDELFAGPYVDNAPDLVLKLHDGYRMIGDLEARQYISRLSPVLGCHRPDGIFIATGNGIASDLDLGELSIADVTPTLLHLMGLAVPTECDGQVQLGLFTPDSEPARRQVIYTDAPAAAPADHTETQDDEAILSRLRDLGYID